MVSTQQMVDIIKKEKVQLIDVRTPEEYSEGSIDGAKNIDFHSNKFEEEIKKLDKNTPILLYCRSGRRSGKASKTLLELGFKKIYDLDGGILKWKEDGLKVKK
ncbi:rhodanese-like domain-containing protein [Seonamhaeicola sp. MEBiC1930]|uniref:rhodanese-like domain-containing protein n=1 Tax=Seonamhaeicola sp. MEBiC01930 TaxID=2976768 RepID=UPI00324802F4